MRTIIHSIAAAALAASLGACGTADEPANDAATINQADTLTADTLVANEVVIEDEQAPAPAIQPAPAAIEPAPSAKPAPAKPAPAKPAPKADPKPEEDPHAGHDMSNMNH
jgi:outer membrane biosynthesis protein TonB